MNSFRPVILTRFSRVTFNAAHKYLGLTSEVLRTEKAINEIACHPLPPSFYEGSGLQSLRQRFDGTVSSTSETDIDYFSISQSSTLVSKRTKSIELLPVVPGTKSKGPKETPKRASLSLSQGTPYGQFSRQAVQAGDLLISTGGSTEVYRSNSRSYSSINTPRPANGTSPKNNEKGKQSVHRGADDFDLKEEVMSCIAKSIGLLQPPFSGSESGDASPAFLPTNDEKRSESFNSPFTSLSLLDIGDDGSSMTGSISAQSHRGYMSGLDNEVEILFFAAGSVLAHAGERNTGTFMFMWYLYVQV